VKAATKKVAAVLCFLLLAYPLSLGPVIRHNRMTMTLDEFPPEWQEVVYGPLATLRNKCRPFNLALNWYLDFWIFPPGWPENKKTTKPSPTPN